MARRSSGTVRKRPAPWLFVRWLNNANIEFFVQNQNFYTFRHNTFHDLSNFLALTH